MRLSTIQDFAQFTSFDLQNLSDSSLYLSFFEPLTFIHLYEVRRSVENQDSFDQLNLGKVISVNFNLFSNDKLCAVVSFPDGIKAVELEQLPEGSYDLFLSIVNRIFQWYLPVAHLEMREATIFKFSVLLNLLETRFIMNGMVGANDSLVFNQVHHYYQLWMKSPLDMIEG